MSYGLGKMPSAERSGPIPNRPRDAGPAFEVIGVVGSTQQHDRQHQNESILYFASEQRYRPILALALCTHGEPSSIMVALQKEVRAIDPLMERLQVRTFDTYVWNSLSQERLQARAVATFAGLGWFLAFIGVAGFMSFTVQRGIRDIGIRMALGAQQRDIWWVRDAPRLA